MTAASRSAPPGGARLWLVTSPAAEDVRPCPSPTQGGPPQMNSALASSRPVAPIVTSSDARAQDSGSTSPSWFGQLSAVMGLVRFGLVGVSGMVVNLVVLTALLRLTSHVSTTTA